MLPTQQFTDLVLDNPDADITAVYNAFIRTLPADQISLVADNYTLFIKCGLAARNAIPEVQALLHS
jgi:hypothetical protein